MKALILCDIDGCLNAGKHAPLDLETLATIRNRIAELREDQIGFTLCTGRPQPYAEAICRLLGLDLPLICENGSMLFFPVSDTILPLVDQYRVKKITELREQIRLEKWFGEHLILEMGKEFSISLTGPVIVNGVGPKLQKIVIEIQTAMAGTEFEVTHSSSSIDITLKGVNKGSALPAMTHALKAEGFEDLKFVGIGDSVADLSFLSKMDLVLAPANACQSVRDASHSISANDHTRGVLDLINSDLMA